MIDYIGAFLDEWGRWSRSQRLRLGHATQSPIHQMMTTNKATTSALHHRGCRHMMVIGDRLVQRDVAPMRAVASARGHINRTPDNPIAEMMEAAITHLREDVQRDALRLKYMACFGDDAAASILRISKATYKGRINMAHAAIDSYLRVAYPNAVRSINSRMIKQP